MWRNWQRMATRRSVGALLALVFSVSLFSSLYFASAGMDMSTGSVGCPFMLHEETLCTMGVLDHVGMWESAFAAMMPVLVLLLVAAVLIRVAWYALPQFFISHIYCKSALPPRVHERPYSFLYRPLQEMFARGVLHPKLF